MLPLYWAGALLISQSPITAYSDGWNQSCPIHQCGAGQYCSHRKVKERRGAKSLQRAFLPMKNKSVIAGTSYLLTLFGPCLQKRRKTP
jgi:hypothetical protein